MLRSLRSLVLAVLFTALATTASANGIHDPQFGVSGPTMLTSGGVQTLSYDLVLTGGIDVQGLAFSLAVTGATVTNVGVGPDMAALFPDFANVELASNGLLDGAAGGFVIDFFGVDEVPDNGPFVFAEVEIEVDTDVVDHFELFYVDGLQGTGQPVQNFVVIGGLSVPPGVTGLEVWVKDGGPSNPIPEPSAALAFAAGLLILRRRVRAAA